MNTHDQRIYYLHMYFSPLKNLLLPVSFSPTASPAIPFYFFITYLATQITQHNHSEAPIPSFPIIQFISENHDLLIITSFRETILKILLLNIKSFIIVNLTIKEVIMLMRYFKKAKYQSLALNVHISLYGHK